MRQNAEHFKEFLSVNPGGGSRRNPKRKNAGAISTPVEYVPPTQEEIDAAFEYKLKDMAKGGTYGDHAEITAFANAFNCNVHIFQSDYTYAIPPKGETTSEPSNVYIAHHKWEHFSSIRNVKGPHSGLPQVELKPSAAEREDAMKATPATAPVVQPWQMHIVQNTLLPYIVDESTITRAITASGGNLNNAVSNLMDADGSGSPSSTQDSSGIERDPDSEDEEVHRPTKRRNHRNQRLINQAAHDLVKARRNVALNDRIVMNNASSDSLNSTAVQVATSVNSSSPAPTPSDVGTKDDDEWTLSQTEDDKGIAKASNTGPIRLKINMSKVTKTHVRQQGAQRRKLMTGRQRKELQLKNLQKKAQEEALMQRARAETVNDSDTTTAKDVNPVVELPIRVIEL